MGVAAASDGRFNSRGAQEKKELLKSEGIVWIGLAFEFEIASDFNKQCGGTGAMCAGASDGAVLAEATLNSVHTNKDHQLR